MTLEQAQALSAGVIWFMALVSMIYASLAQSRIAVLVAILGFFGGGYLLITAIMGSVS